MSHFVKDHYITITNSFLVGLCCNGSILEGLLLILSKYGIKRDLVFKEKKELLDLYDTMDQEAHVFFRDCLDDMKYYFGHPDDNKDYEPLMCFVTSKPLQYNYNTFDKLGQEYSTFEKSLMEMSEETYYSNCGAVLADYHNRIVKQENQTDETKDLIALLRAVMDTQLTSNMKWMIQDILLNRKKHQSIYLGFLKKGIEFIKRFEKPLDKIVDEFYDYWNPRIHGDYQLFLAKTVPLLQGFSESPFGYSLTPSLFYNNISLSGEIDFESKAYRSPVELNIGVLFGETITVEMMMGGESTIFNDTSCTFILKMLSDNSRFDILTYIKNQEAYGGMIAKHLGLTTATVSHHMGSLCDAGLININAKENRVYYSLNTKNIEKCIAYLSDRLLQ